MAVWWLVASQARAQGFPGLVPLASLEHANPGGSPGVADLSIAPDLNGDGFDELLYQGAGVVRLHYGSAAGVSSTPDQEWFGTTFGEYGFAARAVGDIDGDGFGDVAVGSPGKAVFDGKVEIHRGSASGVSAVASYELFGAGGEELGREITAGDFDGDGYQDLAVSSRLGDTGRVSVYPGSALGPAALPSLRIDGGALDELGTSVAVGDVNGDPSRA